MRTVDRWRRIGLSLACFGWLMQLTPAGSARALGSDEPIRLDCGVNSLYILLRLEGRTVSLDRILSALPARHPEGYSMAELSDAAGSLGLSLEGQEFTKENRHPGRPAIAFLKDEKGGHFTVLRPVGTTGTMVQVIDPPLVPWIADYERVLASKSWKGRLLVPREPFYDRPSFTFSIAIALGILLFLVIRPRKSRPSPT